MVLHPHTRHPSKCSPCAEDYETSGSLLHAGDERCCLRPLSPPPSPPLSSHLRSLRPPLVLIIWITLPSRSTPCCHLSYTEMHFVLYLHIAHTSSPRTMCPPLLLPFCLSLHDDASFRWCPWYLLPPPGTTYQRLHYFGLTQVYVLISCWTL